MIDKFNRKIEYARISVTDRCNLRCRYCMPETGIEKLSQSDILMFEEIIRTTKIFAQLGIKKIRITGGEPLLRKNICELISKLKKIDGIEQVAFTTNAENFSNLKINCVPLRGINSEDICQLAEKYNAKIIVDEIQNSGALSGIANGLKHAKND